MGKEVKRVPLNFNWPLNKRWPGYIPTRPLTDEEADAGTWKQHPPIGEGYQLWGNTSEGSPVSPVFQTEEALAEWCATGAHTWGYCRATKEEWLQMFRSGQVYGQFGNLIII